MEEMTKALRLKEPVYIMSRKDYATGERTFEGIVLDNKEVNIQLIITFKSKDKNDLSKGFLELSGSYNLFLAPVEKGEV